MIMKIFASLCVSLCAICVCRGAGDSPAISQQPYDSKGAAPTNSSLVTRHSSLSVWMSTQGRGDMEETIRLCAEQGVDCVEVPTWGTNECRRSLEALRKYGVKGFTSAGEPSLDSRPAARDGKPCERAVCVGGAYRGLAIDRNLFSFTAGPHEIIVEPPVYSRGQPYTRTVKGEDGAARTVRSGHYFGSWRPTGQAEIIVPERLFDGAQHLRVIPCEVLPARPGDKPENDTAAGLSGPEIENRRLARLRFDLADCADCLLDKVGVAVYWECDPEGDAWKRGTGQLSVFSEHTRERARFVGAWRANQWALANGGAFPSNEIVAIRFGDECFNISGWVDSPACSFPLWGFSESGRAAFSGTAPTNSSLVTRHSSLTRPVKSGPVQPRTLGYPEIYGIGAYARARYCFHKACAELVGAFREGVREVAPDLVVFRNTTRADVWSESNDLDGSGQELLARELDFLHIDPYPVQGGGYNVEMIPRDMGYMAGLARRYGKPLIPWMQAHAYAPGGLGHVTPSEMKRMWEQHIPFNPAGMMWLGFAISDNPNRHERMTFPNGSPESWAYAKELFASMHNAQCIMHNGKPEMQNAECRMQNDDGANSSLVTRHSSLTMAASAAIVRPYATRAICCWQSDGRWRNPADRILEAWTMAWGVDNGRQFDVFELSPDELRGDGASSPLVDEIARYPLVVSTIPIPGVPHARVLGAGTEGTFLTQAEFDALRKTFAKEIAAAPQQSPSSQFSVPSSDAPSAPMHDSILLTNSSLRVEISPEWAGRMMFFGRPGGVNALWTNPEAAAYTIDTAGKPLWKNVGGEKTWVGSQRRGWRAFAGVEKGRVWPPPAWFDSMPMSVVTTSPTNAVLQTGVHRAGEWAVSLERAFTLLGDRLVIRQRLILPDAAGVSEPPITNDMRRLWSVAQVPRPDRVAIRLVGEGRLCEDASLPAPVPSDIPGWFWIDIAGKDEAGKIETDGDALATPLSDGSGWLVIEQTAPARHLSAFERPGRAMVYASKTTFRPSAYSELEFAAYGPDAEQTLTFRIAPSLK